MKEYALWRLRDKPGQRTLSAFAAQPLSRSAPAQPAAPAHLPAWSPAAVANARPGLSAGPGVSDARALEQPGQGHGPAGGSTPVHLGAHRISEQPAPTLSGGPAQGAGLEQGVDRPVDAATLPAPAPVSREPGQAHDYEAAALLPEHGASHSALQGRIGSDVHGLAAVDTPADMPGAHCAAAGPRHGQAEPAVQQRPASPVAEPVQAPAPRAAGQLPARGAPALAGAAEPAVWDGPAWPGEDAPMERQAPPSTAARAASGAAAEVTGATHAMAAAGAELPDCGAGPGAERTDPEPSRGCSGESPGDGSKGVYRGASRAGEGPAGTTRPIWSLSQPSQGGIGGDASAHNFSAGASPGWRTGAANDGPAGMRPGSAAMTVPPDRGGAWSGPEPHAGLAVRGRAAAGQGADLQAGGGAQRGAVQPRSNPNPGPPVGARTAEQISAAARAAKDILKGPPRSSRDDPAFQQTFWQASRLHFIGSWKARATAALPLPRECPLLLLACADVVA